VPRSSGGLCYGEILSSSTASRCFFNPKTEHNQELVLVRYGSKQKVCFFCFFRFVLCLICWSTSLFLCVCWAWCRSFQAQKQCLNRKREKMFLKSEISLQVLTVLCCSSSPVSPLWWENSLLSPDQEEVLFAKEKKMFFGNFILVVFQKGFTIGRVMSRHSAKCLSGAPHNVAAWRVLTEEPDDESEVLLFV
jgi:hypothetical protein